VKAACIVVTMGNRPGELARALDSALVQRDADLDVILVLNGCAAPPGLPDGVHVLALPENLGPTGGRNRGAEAAAGCDLLLFLDDDAWYPDEHVAARVIDRFRKDSALGILSLRIDDPEGRRERRQVPRLRAGDAFRSSAVTTFIEGHCAIARAVFERAGGFPEEFFIYHEGTDLAWRAIDAGFTVRYAGDIAVNHPAEPPAQRHAGVHRLKSRNRVYLARRLLPVPFLLVYPVVWLVIDLLRARSLGGARALIAGTWDGIRSDAGPRRPISWRAVWRLTRAGRPPVI